MSGKRSQGARPVRRISAIIGTRLGWWKLFALVYGAAISAGLTAVVVGYPEIHPAALAALVVGGMLGYFLGCYVAIELRARGTLRSKYPLLSGNGTSTEWRAIPHIFAHYLPSNSYPDVKDHFREVPYSPASDDFRTVYLVGGCTTFEAHLNPEDTLAGLLSGEVPDQRVLNAGLPHYTTLHAYHRLVFDIVRGYRPDSVVLVTPAGNEILNFVHHKKGYVAPDFTHRYRSWLPYGGMRDRITRIPSAGLRLLLADMTTGRGLESAGHHIEEISKEFFRLESVKTARRLFDPSTFIKSLELFLSTCNMIGAEFIPVTYGYNAADMQKEPRLTYAWGMDRINEEIRVFCRSNGIKLVDAAAEMDLVPEVDVTNKWHFTRRGNEKRARLIKEKLVLEVPVAVGA